MNFSDEEVKEFRNEAIDMLDLAESGLLTMDRGGEFKPNYDAVFRVFHSLKGGAGMLGLNELQGHMHKLENQLSDTKGRNGATKAEISFFLRGVDCARKLLTGESVQFDYTIAADGAPAGVPAKEIAASATKAAPVPAAAREPKAQLVTYLVDDEQEIIDALTEILVSAGMSVQGFSDPTRLLEQVKRARPDLVITDIKMGDLTGLDVLREVRKLDRDLPVIFVSGFLSREALMEGISLGVFATIEKPFRDSAVISHCLAAATQYRLSRMVDRSINLLLYQFSDLDDFLKSQGKHEIRDTLKREMDSLIEYRRAFRRASTLAPGKEV